MSNNAKSQTPHESTEAIPKESPTGDLSPIQLLALTGLAIFVGEALIMFVMPIFSGLRVTYQAIIDAMLLTLLTAPVLSFLLFRPMVEHIKERKKAERILQELNQNLEHRVEERTQEFDQSNKALKQEIKERRTTEERIRKANDFVQRLVESAPCLMATIDVNSRNCRYVNGRIEDFLGISPDEVAASGGTVFDSIIASTSRELYQKMIQDVIIAPQGEIARGQCLLENSDGKTLLFRMGVVVVMRTPLGEAEEVLVVATPVDDCA